jgi:hypothetical protein
MVGIAARGIVVRFGLSGWDMPDRAEQAVIVMGQTLHGCAKTQFAIIVGDRFVF